MDARLREAARLGFRRLLLPAGSTDTAGAAPGLEPVPVSDVAEALRFLRAANEKPPRRRPVTEP
jgi:predicted ATP-dependent serine protease